MLAGDPTAFIHGLRVMLDPDRADGADGHLRWRITDGPTCGLRLRSPVAVATDGAGAKDEIALSHEVLAELLGGAVSLDEAIASDRVELSGDVARILRMLAAFDVPAFAGSEG